MFKNKKMGGCAAHFLVFELRILRLPSAKIKFGLSHVSFRLYISAVTPLVVDRSASTHKSSHAIGATNNPKEITSE
jgi:hypothetical protein